MTLIASLTEALIEQARIVFERQHAPQLLLTALHAEAERIGGRLTQLYVWSETREATLRAMASQQVSAARAALERQHAELAHFRGEAESWHTVAEQLAAEQRDDCIHRALAGVRGLRLHRALQAWRWTAWKLDVGR